ncbi:MAG: hybrid sensor histidine kinase/response regulator, partial [Acetobacteraceae bacterium]
YTQPQGKIRVETRAEGEMAVISVSDNGMGIPADLLPKVFDLFVQGDRTLDRAEGGLGIGLAVVKKLIHMHSGTITAESGGSGKGATIEIRLPRIAQPAAAKAPAIPGFKLCPRRILVVDDNADAAQSLAMLLSAAGHQTLVAPDGRQALESIASFQPEVALVDIGLPEMDGYELARRVRADAPLNGLKLVAVTGYGQAEDREKARAAGFAHHLLKPIDIAALERILATMGAELADKASL